MNGVQQYFDMLSRAALEPASTSGFISIVQSR